MKGILKYCTPANYVLAMAAIRKEGIKSSRSKEYILQRLRFGCRRWNIVMRQMAMEVKLSATCGDSGTRLSSTLS